MMKKTKYRGIHYRDNKDGTRSYYLRLTIDGKRTWRWAGDTITEARKVQKRIKQIKMIEGLGIGKDFLKE